MIIQSIFSPPLKYWIFLRRAIRLWACLWNSIRKLFARTSQSLAKRSVWCSHACFGIDFSRSCCSPSFDPL